MDNQITIFIIQMFVSGLIGGLTAFFTIGQYKAKVDRALSDIDKLENGQKEIRDKVVACETSLKEREPLTKKKSPVSLTERGKKFLTDSKGGEFIDNNFDELFDKVESKSPQNAYDVQEFSRQVVESLEDDTRINAIKEFLFKDGSTLDDLFTVMSVYLRDKILIKKNWNVDDIDNYAK